MIATLILRSSRVRTVTAAAAMAAGTATAAMEARVAILRRAAADIAMTMTIIAVAATDHRAGMGTKATAMAVRPCSVGRSRRV
jgi:hypothetical protein